MSNSHYSLLGFKTTRRDWAMKEFNSLLDEWRAWKREVDAIRDHPYDTNRQSDVFADGEENMSRHAILQTKTITFLDNNISGHGFVVGRDGNSIDRTDLRLRIRVRHRIQELEELSASLQYATVPDSFWKEKAKALVSAITANPSNGADILEKALRNPFT